MTEGTREEAFDPLSNVRFPDAGAAPARKSNGPDGGADGAENGASRGPRGRVQFT
jgi:hypothetical protein